MNNSIFILILLGSLSLQGCVTIFSEFQSADTLGKGNSEITPSYSYNGYISSDDAEGLQHNFGMQYGIGVDKNADLRLRLEIPMLVQEPESFGDVFVVGLGPKFNIYQQRASLYIPFGLALGKDIETSDTFEVHPTIIYALNQTDELEINTSLKFIIPYQSERDRAIAFNLGFANWSNQNAFRPEIGVLRFLGEDTEGVVIQIGGAVSFRSFKN